MAFYSNSENENKKIESKVTWNLFSIQKTDQLSAKYLCKISHF